MNKKLKWFVPVLAMMMTTSVFAEIHTHSVTVQTFNEPDEKHFARDLKLAKQGNPIAQNQVGSYYLHKKDYAKALIWF